MIRKRQRTLLPGLVKARYALLVAIIPIATQPALAQQPNGFQCPKAGTIERFEDGRTLTFGGSKKSDEAVCVVEDSFRQVRNGELLYNLYPTDLDSQALRDGMNDLFSGKRHQVSFGAVTHYNGRSATWTYTWTRGESSNIQIGGHAVPVTIFEFDAEAADFHAKYRRYLDGASHAWVRYEFIPISGPPFAAWSNATHQAQSITVP